MDGLRGLSGHYWDRVAGRMRNVAFACRYGMQDAAAILGRRMTPTEFALFVRCTEEWLDREFKPREDEPEDERATTNVDDDDDLTGLLKP